MKKKILCGVLLLLTMIFYGIEMAMADNALVATWIPWTICGSMALISGLTLWRIWAKLTGSEKFWLNYACHVVFSCGLLLCAFYGLNKSFADKETLHCEKVVVERKYYKVRHKTRRVGRRTYANGEPYKVYFLEIRFPDGRTKEMPATTDYYRKIHKGDTISLEMEMGLFRIPVIVKRV